MQSFHDIKKFSWWLQNRKGKATLPLVQKKIHQITDQFLYCLCYLVFERVVHDQTEEFLSLNKTLYGYQSSFRKNHLTDTSLSFLNDRI